MHLNIDGKSLTASKSALNDYKTAIEQLPDSEALKHDCLERAQQCRKDAEAEVAEHQQELARQQEVFAEMEREIPQVQTSIGNCNEEIQHLRNRLSDAEDDDQRSSLYEQIHAAENRRRNLEEELERCEEKKKVAQERMDAETILIKKYQEKCEELTTLYQNLESSLSQYSENMVQYRSTVTAKATDMMGALDQISSIQQSYENFSLSGGDIGSGAGGFSSGAAMLGSGGGSMGGSSYAAVGQGGSFVGAGIATGNRSGGTSTKEAVHSSSVSGESFNTESDFHPISATHHVGENGTMKITMNTSGANMDASVFGDYKTNNGGNISISRGENGVEITVDQHSYDLLQLADKEPILYQTTSKIDGKNVTSYKVIFQQPDTIMTYYNANRMSNNVNMTDAKQASSLSPIGTDGKPINTHHITREGFMTFYVDLEETYHQEHTKELHSEIEDYESFRNEPTLKKSFENFKSQYYNFVLMQYLETLTGSEYKKSKKYHRL